jgi:hypothetical protein
MAIEDTGTILVITPVGTDQETPVLAPFTARGIKQTLKLLPGNQRRTVNAELIDLTPERFRLYSSTISATDQEVPAFDNTWKGLTVIVDCAAELKYPAGGTPQRQVVSGSSVDDGDFVRYRPQLTMMITDLSIEHSEWDAEKYSWSIDLEEVSAD